MNECERQQYIDLLKQEVVPACGCTEPGAVALCVTRACETLGREPEQIDLWLSKNVYKNAMGVGIPGTGMIGLPIAVAMAVTAGRSERGLEVLTVTADEIASAKRWLANHAGSIRIKVKEVSEKLYIECICSAGACQAKAVIAARHDQFVFVGRRSDTNADWEVLEQKTCGNATQCKAAPSLLDSVKLSVGNIYDFATTTPIEALQFIKQTVVCNHAAAEDGLKGCGLHTGQVLMQYAGDDIVHQVVAHTVAASDARMSGCMLPVYSNSGSGNQGICCTLPIYEYGIRKPCTDEQITRALVLSHLMSIYIKRGIGRLSALCGLVNASMGVASGLVYLNGGNVEQIGYALKNMINTLTGMVCDGAKPSCALKMATGIYTAFVSARLAHNNIVVDPTDGLSECDVDNSIRDLGRLGHDGMNETDDIILDIMTHKQQG